LQCDFTIQPPASRTVRVWTREEAIVELLRGRLAIVGPTDAETVAHTMGIGVADVDTALLTLEAEGVVLRGSFTGAGRPEWCDRRLLARIHRYTLTRLRAEIEPVSPADFMRFLFAWQHVSPAAKLTGVEGVRAIVEQLDGFELAAEAWERAILPARMDGYDPSWLDLLCLTGEVGWARRSAGAGSESTQLVGATPIALFLRGSKGPSPAPGPDSENSIPEISDSSRRVLDLIRARGALFTPELAAGAGLHASAVRSALSELVAVGLVASDGFGGLRSLLRGGMEQLSTPTRSAVAGRWSLICREHGGDDPQAREAVVDAYARTLLRRYGVVFRKLLTREAGGVFWRELTRVYRRLEARGEIRGGRFVAGMSGEQFALPDAVDRLRELRRTAPDGRAVAISAADPLNLAGIVTAGERVRSIASNRVAYRDGVPVAALEGEYIRPLTRMDSVADTAASEVATILTGRLRPPVVSGFVGR
jgi:ATP-dependent Lhr-like helicase